MAMYTKQTQMEMDALEASLISYGLVPRMRLTYNADIVAVLPIPTGGTIDLDYNHLGTGEYITYDDDGHRSVHRTLRAALESVGLLPTTPGLPSTYHVDPVASTYHVDPVVRVVPVALQPISQTKETTDMYLLTRQGLVYFTDVETKAPVYLCGGRITYRTPSDVPNIIVEGRPEGPRITAYYSTNVNLAVTIWEWYTGVCEVVPYADCSLSLRLDITIGSKGFEWHTPLSLSIGSKRVCVHHPLVGRGISDHPLNPDKVGIYWKGVDSEGNEYTTTEAVTPNSLAVVTRPSLKSQSMYDYAFKVGTLCPLQSGPPDWNKAPIHGHGSSDKLDRYFALGKMYKPGVLVGDIPFEMREEML